MSTFGEPFLNKSHEKRYFQPHHPSPYKSETIKKSNHIFWKPSNLSKSECDSKINEQRLIDTFVVVHPDLPTIWTKISKRLFEGGFEDKKQNFDKWARRNDAHKDDGFDCFCCSGDLLSSLSSFGNKSPKNSHLSDFRRKSENGSLNIKMHHPRSYHRVDEPTLSH